MPKFVLDVSLYARIEISAPDEATARDEMRAVQDLIQVDNQACRGWSQTRNISGVAVHSIGIGMECETAELVPEEDW